MVGVMGSAKTSVRIRALSFRDTYVSRVALSVYYPRDSVSITSAGLLADMPCVHYMYYDRYEC